MTGLRQAAGLIAALILALAGGVLVGGSPLLGGALLVVGLGAGAWQAWQLWRNRRDPYDLSRLWEHDSSNDEPEESADEDDWQGNGEPELLYCHHCGHGVPPPHVRCPECGQRLG